MGKTYRIRKLTERECLRLMAVTDADIDRIQHYPLIPDKSGNWVIPEGMDEKTAKKLTISGSQQYKMAGNSIVVACLEGIFKNLFRKDEYFQETLF